MVDRPASRIKPRRVFPPLRTLLVLVAAFTAIAAAQNESTIATGRKALDYLLAERFTELTTLFSPGMKENITLDVLQGRVHAEMSGFGTPGAIGTPVVGRDGRFTAVSFPVEFSKNKVSVQFNLEESGQLAAIHFRPADAPLPPAWHHPAYSKADAFAERAVSIGADPWKLGGTLTVPVGKGPFPAAVLVHGPGPNDRDETLRANKIFADLAEGLSSRGIAVLRYDKRTRIYGRQLSESGFTLREEVTDDALAAAAFLRAQPDIDGAHIYLIGHSLGGYAAPRIAKQDGKLAGVIFLAANARPVEDLILDQTEYLAAAGVVPAAEAQKRLELIKTESAKVKALKPGAENPPVVMGLPTEWLLDVKDYDPAAVAKGLPVPLLFLQGERDFQVSPKEFALWKASLEARPRTTFKSYPDLNHLFITGTGKSVPAEYATPGNVSPVVIDDISNWIRGTKK